MVGVGVEAGGALFGAPLHQRVGQDEFGVHDPRERDHGGGVLAFQVDADRVVLDAGQHAAEALAALGDAVELDPRFVARDLVDDRFVRKAIASVGGPAAFGLPADLLRKEVLAV